MTSPVRSEVPLRHPRSFYIDGSWVTPSTDSLIDVIDPATEELFFRVAEAREADVARAVGAARRAFDDGPWPTMRHTERAHHLRVMGEALRQRADDIGQIWPRQSGALHSVATARGRGLASVFDFYAGLAETFPFEERAVATTGGNHGLLVREPVGVVAAIVPWNSPLSLTVFKLAPALLAGCTVVLKPAPEAPGEAYLLAEIADAAGLPAGVLNVVTADREVSELLVRDPRVDKVAFTGSTAAGRRIAGLLGERIGRYTLELGGKSAAMILDDADLGAAARTLAQAECFLSGQVCASLTRIIVSRSRHDEFVDALAAAFASTVVGDPFDDRTQMGPLAMGRQRDRVEGYIARGIEEGARLVTGGGRPKHLDHGFYIEPTVFANVDNDHTIARDEIFGPVLAVLPADDEQAAVRIANDSIYGLNAAVFTEDVDRARDVARRLRSGTVAQNAFRLDFGIAFGGFKQSGIGREGGIEGLLPYLETKTVLLDGPPS